MKHLWMYLSQAIGSGVAEIYVINMHNESHYSLYV